MALKRKKKIEINAEGSQEGGDSQQEEQVVRDADFSQLEEAENGGISEDAASPGDGSEEVSKLKQEVDEHRQNYLRALADLENFKKRAQRERSELLKYQGEKILLDMVEILDNLDLAIEHAEADAAQLRDGVRMIHKMFLDALARWGVRGESGAGEPFDPNKHSAISQLPSEDVEPGVVLNELKKAYFYKDRLLRAAEVVVATAPARQSSEPAAAGVEEELEEQAEGEVSAAHEDMD